MQSERHAPPCTQHHATAIEPQDKAISAFGIAGRSRAPATAHPCNSLLTAQCICTESIALKDFWPRYGRKGERSAVRVTQQTAAQNCK
jgi:hypothetical protein